MNYVKYEVHAIGGPGHCGQPLSLLLCCFLEPKVTIFGQRWSCQFTPESLINKLYSKLGETYWTVCTTQHVLLSDSY